MRNCSVSMLALIALALCGLNTAAAQTRKLRSVLPAPTGPLAIGRSTIYWKDDARPMSAEDTRAGGPRQIRADVWYPAEPDATSARAEYCPDLPALKSRLGLEAAALGNIETHTLVDPPLAQARPRWPLILFSPGHGNNGVYYTALAEELVSHGYVVVTVDHPYQSSAIAYPDGSVVSVKQPDKELLASGDRERIFQDYKDRVAARVGDLRLALDGLAMLDSGKLQTRFAGRLDLSRVGAAGHSTGGVAAASMAMADARIKAAANLDGHAQSRAGIPDSQGNGPRQPFVELTDSHGLSQPTDEQLAKWKVTRAEFERGAQEEIRRGDDFMRSVAEGSWRVVIPGLTHQGFSDTVLWIGADPRPRHRQVQMIRDYLRAFFDKHLLDKTDTLFDATDGPYAEVTVERFAPAK